MTSDRTQIGIRRTICLRLEHVYKVSVWAETNVNIKYCAIFRCTLSQYLSPVAQQFIVQLAATNDRYADAGRESDYND